MIKTLENNQRIDRLINEVYRGDNDRTMIPPEGQTIEELQNQFKVEIKNKSPKRRSLGKSSSKDKKSFMNKFQATMDYRSNFENLDLDSVKAQDKNFSKTQTRQ